MGSVQALPPPHISSFGYGFHMWVSSGENQWYFNGMYGQNMILSRKEKIVIVCNASNSDMFQKVLFWACVRMFFLAVTGHLPIPKNSEPY